MQFKDIVGQDEIKQRLIQTVVDNRVSHAQLFLGESGVGKLALAIAYAQYINCKDRTQTDSCGICPSCLKYQKMVHPDLHFIFPIASTKEVKKPQSKDFMEPWRALLQKNDYYVKLQEWFEEIGIENKQGIINKDDCNNIIKTLGYKAYEAEYKVMIIWMAEKLFHAAAPKILKILEEPPEKTLFILISENRYQILNTIYSRTQLIKIPRLKDQVMIDELINQKNCSNDEARKLVSNAEGSYKNVLLNLNANEEELINFKHFSRWMRCCYQNNLQEIISFTSEVSKIGREKQKSLLSYSLRTIRNSFLLNLEEDGLVKLEAEERKFASKFAPFIHRDNIQKFTDEINQALFHIERNANPSILFLDLSLQVVRLLQLKASGVS